MVQIVSAVLIITMAAAPILGAPVVESWRPKASHAKASLDVSGTSGSTVRPQTGDTVALPNSLKSRVVERRGGGFAKFKKAASVAGAIADGVGTVATIASIGAMLHPSHPQRRETDYEDLLEVRERINELILNANIHAQQDQRHSHIQSREPQASTVPSSSRMSAVKGIGKAIVAGISLGSAFAPFVDSAIAAKAGPKQRRDIKTASESDLEARMKSIPISSSTLLNIGKAVVAAGGFAAVIGGTAAAAYKEHAQRDLIDLDSVDVREPDYRSIAGSDISIRAAKGLDELD